LNIKEEEAKRKILTLYMLNGKIMEKTASTQNGGIHERIGNTTIQDYRQGLQHDNKRKENRTGHKCTARTACVQK
jgi:hypothetical protein